MNQEKSELEKARAGYEPRIPALLKKGASQLSIREG